MNPTAIVFYIFGASLGYVLGESAGALIGLAVTTGLTVVADVCAFGSVRRR